MTTGSAKRSPPKSDLTPTRARRSASKALKVEQSSPAPNTSSPMRTPTKVSPSQETSFSHRLPTPQQRRGNGRVPGRSLIMWNRPRMAEKLLLQIHYECFRHKIQVPWDAIAHRLHPGSTGAAVLQHFNRLRRDVIAEGHLVPPMPNKPGTGANLDPEIRGYVRMYPEGRDKTTTRPVMFSEDVDDAKLNLPDAFDDENEQDGELMGEGDLEGEADVPATPTPTRPAARVLANVNGVAQGHEVDGVMDRLVRHGAYNGPAAPVDSSVSRGSANRARGQANRAKDIHPDFRAWGPFADPYQYGHVFGAGAAERSHDSESWGASPFASAQGGGQLPRNMPAPPMLAYPRAGGFMPMPVGMHPSFFQYPHTDAYGAAPQRPERDAGATEAAESPDVETKLETPPTDADEATVAPSDLLVRDT